ncbi:MAG: murein L,D-transpeptidase catalytic domain family protein [Chitinophagaceae bacterium]|nr:MAG: murein L,D-transpeptidase catalytic domain family protein [Chitinophagaceae bacterium]
MLTRLLLFCLLLFSTTGFTQRITGIPEPSVKTKAKAAEALAFCKKQKMNTQLCILIDMSVHSGRKRMFVWDFKTGKVIYSCLVSHGCCDSPWGKDRTRTSPGFSNKDGSHCTSLGKYKLGERGWSNWGIHVKYLMHGLEPGNRNALQRQIVFHSWEAISDLEVYPSGAPEGWGCPAVSDKSMRYIDSFLKKSTRPVLMWIYK